MAPAHSYRYQRLETKVLHPLLQTSFDGKRYRSLTTGPISHTAANAIKPVHSATFDRGHLRSNDQKLLPFQFIEPAQAREEGSDSRTLGIPSLMLATSPGPNATAGTKN